MKALLVGGSGSCRPDVVLVMPIVMALARNGSANNAVVHRASAYLVDTVISSILPKFFPVIASILEAGADHPCAKSGPHAPTISPNCGINIYPFQIFLIFI